MHVVCYLYLILDSIYTTFKLKSPLPYIDALYAIYRSSCVTFAMYLLNVHLPYSPATFNLTPETVQPVDV